MVAKNSRDPAVKGKNMSTWFPDEAVAAELELMAERLNTSSSAIIYELVRKAMPVIAQNTDKREIPLDGVRVRL